MNVEWLKRQAKKLKKETGVKHSVALDEVAKGQGYQNWAHLLKEHRGEK